MTHIDAIAREIARAVSNVGRLKARSLLREMREQAEARDKARKQEKRRKFELGEIVVRCGLAGWDSREIAGMLLHGKRHAEESSTMRLAFGKSGAALLNNTPAQSLH